MIDRVKAGKVAKADSDGDAVICFRDTIDDRVKSRRGGRDEGAVGVAMIQQRYDRESMDGLRG